MADWEVDLTGLFNTLGNLAQLAEFCNDIVTKPAAVILPVLTAMAGSVTPISALGDLAESVPDFIPGFAEGGAVEIAPVPPVVQAAVASGAAAPTSVDSTSVDSEPESQPSGTPVQQLATKALRTRREQNIRERRQRQETEIPYDDAPNHNYDLYVDKTLVAPPGATTYKLTMPRFHINFT